MKQRLPRLLPYLLSAIAALLGLGALLYIDSGQGAERKARLYGCNLCHRDGFATLLPALRPWQKGQPLRPLLQKNLRRQHPWLPQEDEAEILDYLLARQLPALAEARTGERAQALYQAKCSACHGTDGQGQAGLYPPLLGSEWLQETPSRLPEILSQGLQGPIRVRGEAWDSSMLAPKLHDAAQQKLLIDYLRRRFGQGE